MCLSAKDHSLLHVMLFFFLRISITCIVTRGKADDHNSIHGHPKMADEKSGQYLYCLLKCFYIIFFIKHTLVRCKCIKDLHGNHKLLPRNVHETGNSI